MEMKDSGSRQQFEGGAQRDTATGKPVMSLLSPHIIQILRSEPKSDEEDSEDVDFTTQHMKTGRWAWSCLAGDIKQFQTDRSVASLYDALHLMITMHGVEPLCDWLEKGAVKYSRDNWKKGMPFTRVIDSLLRHLHKLYDVDENHVAATMCNLMFLIHYVEEIKAGRLDSKWDDMYEYGKGLYDYRNPEVRRWGYTKHASTDS